MQGSARAYSMLGCLVVAAISRAQIPFSAAADSIRSASVVVGGTLTADILFLRGTSPGVPLRYGNVIPKSERVEFQGKTLLRGTDYQMDYDAGVVYLMRAQKAGQAIRVSYRYNPAVQPTQIAGSSFAGLPAFQFSVLPGALNLVMGLGMTERTADGAVMSTNIYGTNNSLKFGSANLGGLLLLGERQNTNAMSDYEYRGTPMDPGDSRSKFILQNFSSKLSSGSIEVGYQDISTNFSGFSAVKGAGFDQARVDQLQKERGLKRMSLGIKDVGIGSMKLNQNFRNVRDGENSVEWRSFGIQSGGLKLDWSGQKVDQGFTRFADLAEADRDQLMREVGLSRENMLGEYKSSLGALKFNATQVEDGSGEGVYRRSFGFDSSKFKLNLGDQAVDSGFTRFDSLFEPEKYQWGREIGLKRQWLSMEAALLGRDSAPLKYSESSLAGPAGGFHARDVSASGKSWSLEHSSRSVADGFTSVGAMTEAELDASNAAIARMYTPDPYAPRPEDRAAFAMNSGLKREFTKLALTPFKDWNASIESLRLRGRSDGGQVDALHVHGKNIDFNYRSQRLGDQFTELGGMLELERGRLGMIPGLSKLNFDLGMNIGKGRATYEQMTADTAAGGASRTSMTYRDNKIDISVTNRDVAPTFTQSAMLVDPEKDLLAALQGFKQQDIKARWQILANLSIQTQQWQARSDALNQSRYYRNTQLDWSPDGKTKFSFLHNEQRNDDPLQLLFANVMDRLSFSRDLGRLGLIEYINERQNFDGALSTSPDMDRQYFAFSTKLNEKTAVKTEQTRTRFDNGDKEDVSANTLSTEITKRSGVSVTDVRVDRTGSERDETRRNYGFWLDFGNGMRLNYGYARQLLGPAGTLQSSLSLTPGNVGGINFGGGSYAENRWDGINTQGLANMSMNTTKPFRLGFLKDINVNVALDTATDQTNWVRENKFAKVDGKIAGNTLGYEYRSQIHPLGYRAIDRAYRFATDQSENRWFRASLDYKIRELPDQGQTIIRNFTFGVKPTKGLELTHQLLTNPEEQFRTDVMLGSLTSPMRVNRWKLDYNPNAKWGIAATWEEKRNDLTQESSRLGGVTLDLFKTSGSPLQLFYGVEQLWGNVDRRTAHRYYVKFDQRPGPNQLLSLFAGNVSYEHTIAEGLTRQNWTIHVDYQIRF